MALQRMSALPYEPFIKSIDRWMEGYATLCDMNVVHTHSIHLPRTQFTVRLALYVEIFE